MNEELLSLLILIITFITVSITIIIGKNIGKCGKIVNLTLVTISTIISFYLVFDYQKIKNSQYKYTKELIMAQRHLLIISDYVLTLEKDVNNNNIFNNWCDNEVLQCIKETADTVNTLNQDYDIFLKNK